MAYLPYHRHFAGGSCSMAAVAPANCLALAYSGLSEFGGLVHVFVLVDVL